MDRDAYTAKEPLEPLEERVKADCSCCKKVDVYFNFIGVNHLILDSPISEFLLAKYGKGALYLYGCESCSTSMTLASLEG